MQSPLPGLPSYCAASPFGERNTLNTMAWGILYSGHAESCHVLNSEEHGNPDMWKRPFYFSPYHTVLTDGGGALLSSLERESPSFTFPPSENSSL